MTESAVHVAVLAAHAPPQVRPQAILLGKLLRRLPRPGLDVSLLTSARIGTVDNAPVFSYRPAGRLVAAALARLQPGNPWRQTRLLHAGAFRSARRMLAVRPADVLMSFANPYAVNILGAQLGARHALPHIAHYSDPFVDSPYNSLPARERRGRLAAERRVLEQAATVVFVNEQLRDWVLDRHPTGTVRRSAIIPHSFDRSLYPDISAPRAGSTVLVRHVGALYGPRNGLTFLDALARLRDETPAAYARLRIEFIGPDLYRANGSFEAEAHRRGLDGSVAVRPVMPYSESLHAMSGADMLLNIDAGEGPPIFLTSKLVDYLGAGRPILCLTQPGSPSEAICRRAGGAVADVRDADAIAAALRDFTIGDRNQSLDQNYIENFAIERISAAWADLFRKVATDDAA